MYVQRHHKSESQRSVEKSTISVLDVPGTLMIQYVVFVFFPCLNLYNSCGKNPTILTIFSALRGDFCFSLAQVVIWPSGAVVSAKSLKEMKMKDRHPHLKNEGLEDDPFLFFSGWLAWKGANC